MSAAAGEAGVVLAPPSRSLPRHPSRTVLGSRPGTLVLVGLTVAALVVGTVVIQASRPPRTAPPSLLLDGVARDHTGALLAVPAGTRAAYLPGSRVLDPATPAAAEAAEAAAEADRAWLAAGSLPGRGGPYEEMVAGALLDLRTLLLPNGALLAGNSPRWRYVWPRDASFAAVALAAAGHPRDAERILLHVQDLHLAGGVFHARYLPDGTGAVPDDRSPQADGAGWVLWATGEVLAELPSRPARAETATRLTPLVDAARAFVAEQTAAGGGLPLPSSDYWEVREDRLTLGTAAPLLAGLEAASRIYETLGRASDAAGARTDAADLRSAVVGAFASDGYPRRQGGGPSDAATAFALPPFQPTALEGARAAWEDSIPGMLRPAGGLAPGAGWRDDGISWTPQTALYALTAAWQGDEDRAHHLLTWLSEHRTASGALPEKVLADGSPAAVAPLAWTCALVVLAVDALDERAAVRLLSS